MRMKVTVDRLAGDDNTSNQKNNDNAENADPKAQPS